MAPNRRPLTVAQQTALMRHLDGLELLPGIMVAREHHGPIVIYRASAPGVEIFATPDYEEADTLQIEVWRDGTIEGEIVAVQWTGDIEADRRLWVSAVMPYVQRHLYPANVKLVAGTHASVKRRSFDGL